MSRATSCLRLLITTGAAVLCFMSPASYADGGGFPAKYLGLVGNYHTPTGGLLAVERTNHGMQLLNYATGLESDLAEAADGSFRVVDAPDQETLSFHAGLDAHAESLSLSSGDIRVDAERAPYSTEDVMFTGGDGVKLGGTLWMPAGKGPFPALVFVHGSGPVTRYQFGEFANFAVDRGYAVLTYDKRGSGVSGGDFNPWATGLSQLADDALAGLELLRAQPGVRPAQVGLFGISNGSWVVVQAAARSAHVEFVVLAVGGGVPMLQDDLYEADMQARRAGMSEADVRKQDAILARLLGPLDPAVGSAAAAQQTRALLAEEAPYPWYTRSHADQAATAPDAQLLGMRESLWRNETSYDPARDLEKIKVPVLAIMGAKDELTPTRENEIGLATHLAAAGDPDVSLRVLAGASHWMTLGFADRDPGVDVYAPGLFETLGSWLGRLSVEERAAGREPAAKGSAQ